MGFFTSRVKIAVIALITANIIWGAAPPIFKWALEDIDPFTLAFLRFAIGAIIILPFAYKQLKVARQDIAEVFLIGFLGVAINIAFFFLGLKYAPSINSSIIFSAGPIFLIIAGFIFLKERPRQKLIIGSLIGLAGVVLIIVKPLISEEPNLSFFGNALFFISMLGALGHTIMGRQLLKKYEPMGLTFWSFVVGALCFAPLMVTETMRADFVVNITLPVIVGVLFGAVLCSALAYSLLFYALKHMPAAETGVFVYIDPLVTVLVAYPLLGEKPDIYYFLGAAFVLFGIYIAEGRIHWHPLHLLKRG